MKITFSLGEQVVRRARKVARAMGKSVNQLVREYLEQLASQDDPECDIEELKALSKKSGGNYHGWTFDRDELHARKP